MQGSTGFGAGGRGVEGLCACTGGARWRTRGKQGVQPHLAGGAQVQPSGQASPRLLRQAAPGGQPQGLAVALFELLRKGLLWRPAMGGAQRWKESVAAGFWPAQGGRRQAVAALAAPCKLALRGTHSPLFSANQVPRRTRCRCAGQ